MHKYIYFLLREKWEGNEKNLREEGVERRMERGKEKGGDEREKRRGK